MRGLESVVLSALHRDCTVGRNGDASEGGSFTDAISDSHVETDGSNEKEEREKTGQDTLAVNIQMLLSSDMLTVA